MLNVFISYRREDTLATAGRLRDRLVAAFGTDHVFMDVEDIPAGHDFTYELTQRVARCDVLLALIGARWEPPTDASHDWLGVELAMALAQTSTRVIPLLIDGASMPLVATLPPQLQPLVRRQSMSVQNTQFHSDVSRLINHIADKLPTRAARTPTTTTMAVLAVLILGLAGLCVGTFYWLGKNTGLVVIGPAAVRSSDPVAGMAANPNRVSGRPTAATVGEALVGRLQREIGATAAHVSVRLRGGDKVKLGDEIVIEVQSEVAGRLVLLDVNAEGQLVQLFPNSFVSASNAGIIGAQQVVTIPSPQYGFSGFKAVEPVGLGQLVVLVFPSTVDEVGGHTYLDEQAAKGFRPVMSVDAFIQALIEDVNVHNKGSKEMALFGFNVRAYEIVP